MVKGENWVCQPIYMKFHHPVASALMFCTVYFFHKTFLLFSGMPSYKCFIHHVESVYTTNKNKHKLYYADKLFAYMDVNLVIQTNSSLTDTTYYMQFILAILFPCNRWDKTKSKGGKNHKDLLAMFKHVVEKIFCRTSIHWIKHTYRFCS